VEASAGPVTATFAPLLPQPWSPTVVVAAAAVIPFLPLNVDAQAYSATCASARNRSGSGPLVWGCTFLLCLWIPPLFVVAGAAAASGTGFVSGN